ncbi:hypothetical protein M2347_000079 [Chryseobacterium sp. H1D6B]|uniref:hypothetical protein n=1 Tax=Chryseobacterium sp. H1D6B TaxID=2940588 RepID=UPI0015CAE1B3|nr:hypothetical protein [Chryseobacterium sp. H1D6B]MDH6250352.1 hypothetical protein [Chryseobacterium sp. H1D6B]
MAVKTIKEPKITFNKLGEFLVASQKRQRAILEHLKLIIYLNVPDHTFKQSIKFYYL